MNDEAISKPKSNRMRWPALAAWLAFCFAASASAAFVSTEGWYDTLHKPTWNPPSWLFGPVWTCLYLSMAVAAWLIQLNGGWEKQRRLLGLFVIQWALNAAWTPLFFGLHWIGIALVELIMLWIAVLAVTILFFRERKTAGILLVPYLLWVSFAAFLNFTIWQLNR